MPKEFPQQITTTSPENVKTLDNYVKEFRNFCNTNESFKLRFGTVFQLRQNTNRVISGTVNAIKRKLEEVGISKEDVIKMSFKDILELVGDVKNNEISYKMKFLIREFCQFVKSSNEQHILTKKEEIPPIQLAQAVPTPEVPISQPRVSPENYERLLVLQSKPVINSIDSSIQPQKVASASNFPSQDEIDKRVKDWEENYVNSTVGIADRNYLAKLEAERLARIEQLQKELAVLLNVNSTFEPIQQIPAPTSPRIEKPKEKLDFNTVYPNLFEQFEPYLLDQNAGFVEMVKFVVDFINTDENFDYNWRISDLNVTGVDFGQIMNKLQLANVVFEKNIEKSRNEKNFRPLFDWIKGIIEDPNSLKMKIKIPQQIPQEKKPPNIEPKAESSYFTAENEKEQRDKLFPNQVLVVNKGMGLSMSFCKELGQILNHRNPKIPADFISYLVSLIGQTSQGHRTSYITSLKGYFNMSSTSVNNILSYLYPIITSGETEVLIDETQPTQKNIAVLNKIQKYLEESLGNLESLSANKDQRTIELLTEKGLAIKKVGVTDQDYQVYIFTDPMIAKLRKSPIKI